MGAGAKIAVGREAEILEWSPDADGADGRRVLKLYFRGHSREHANRERAITALLKAAGAAVPAVFGDVVERDGRYGIVYERIDGTDMLDILSSRPWRIASLGRSLGEIHARMHEAKPDGLPPLKEGLAHKIAAAGALTEEERERLVRMLSALPDGDRPCHGDLHPGNIIVREDGRPVIIDWVNAAVGDPMADVARSQLVMSVGWRVAPGRITSLLGRWGSGWLLRAYTSAYFAASGADPSGVDPWRTVIAAARLGEHIPEESRYVARLVRAGLADA